MPEIRHHPSICRCDIGFRRKPIVVLIVIAERTGALCLGLGNKLSSLMIFNEHWVYLVHSASVQSPSALNHPAHNLSVCFLTRHVRHVVSASRLSYIWYFERMQPADLTKIKLIIYNYSVDICCWILWVSFLYHFLLVISPTLTQNLYVLFKLWTTWRQNVRVIDTESGRPYLNLMHVVLFCVSIVSSKK